jgi:hypothetical protein
LGARLVVSREKWSEGQRGSEGDREMEFKACVSTRARGAYSACCNVNSIQEADSVLIVGDNVPCQWDWPCLIVLYV